jgi:hypothetical protein
MKTARSIEVIEALTNDARNDAQRVLYALLTGTKLRRPAARSAWQSRGSSENPRGTLKEATEVNHEEFAERAGRRLEAVADRLEGDAGRLGIDGEALKTKARAQELRVGALLVRDEAVAVAREEREAPTLMIAENLSLEAQG